MPRHAVSIAFVLLVGTPFFATRASAVPVYPAYVIVGDYFRNTIQRFDLSGHYLDTLATLDNPGEILRHDGYLYVRNHCYFSDVEENIERINLTTNKVEVFVSAGYIPGGRGFDFGPDGNLYVADANAGKIREFDGRTGSYIKDFITGISVPITPRFGPDGNLYIARGHNQMGDRRSSILKYNGTTGEYLGVFSAAGIETPQNLIFGPDGDLYVSNQSMGHTYDVVRFDGHSGAVVRSYGQANSGGNNQGMALLPDGTLLVAKGGGSVMKYNAGTGQSMGTFYNSGSFTMGVAYVPEPGTLQLLGVGVVGLVVYGWRRRKG
jgi:WD40 repeat protein